MEPLQRRGLRVEAIDLPSRGDSGQPLGDLYADADAVTARLDAIGEPTLLVGHSYGGMVVTDAGGHDAVTGLVYVGAFLPPHGKSALDVFGEQAPEGAAGSELLACTRLTDDGSASILDPDGAAGALYGDCDEAVQRWALERLAHQSMASVTQVPRRQAWAVKPTTYVVCADDRALPAWQQRSMAHKVERVVELPTSHSPFLSRPDELADILATAARTPRPEIGGS